MDIGYRCYGGHQFSTTSSSSDLRPICLMPGIHSFPCCSVNPGAVTQSRSGKAQVGKRSILFPLTAKLHGANTQTGALLLRLTLTPG